MGLATSHVLKDTVHVTSASTVTDLFLQSSDNVLSQADRQKMILNFKNNRLSWRRLFKSISDVQGPAFGPFHRS